MRAEIEALGKRVAELEKKQAAAPTAAAKAKARAEPRAGTPRQSAATPAKSAATPAKKAPAKPSAAGTAAKTTGPKPKPATRAARKPQARRVAQHAVRRQLMAKVEFDSEDEFVEVIDEVFTMMDTDPDMGPKLRDADVPQRFEFTDLDLVVNIRAAEDGEKGNLHWEWSDEVDWEPKVKMAMSSETANKYFQGKENVAVALARRRIKSGGDVKAALSLIPITKPIYARYRDYLEREHPHLLV